MIKKLLYDMSTSFTREETTLHSLNQYHYMKSDPGWKVHQSMLVAILNKISEYMLSDRFTKLDKDIKDAQQRAFHDTKEIIDFLLDPLKGAKKYSAVQRYNKQLEATKRKQPKGGK